MSRFRSTPAIVTNGQAVNFLNRIPRDHTHFDEAFLQKLLEDCPNLLPVNELRDNVGSLLCIGREVPVPGGFIDNLYLSTEGYPVIVETKLWRNPQARREVFSQTLDYIKDVVQLDYEWFESQNKQYLTKQGLPDTGLWERLSELSVDELDEQFLVDRVNKALSRGDIIGLIVGDGIQTRLQELVAHFCKDSSHLRYSLAMVELTCYEIDGGSDSPILVVPRIIQDVEPVQRAYVRVDFASGLESTLKATPIEVPEVTSKSQTRLNLNEDDFLQSVTAAIGRDNCDALRAFYNDLINSLGLQADIKSATIMLKLPHPDGEFTGASLFAVDRQGRVYNTKHMAGQLKSWGLGSSIVSSATAAYWSSLNGIEPRFRKGGIAHVATSQFIPFPEISAKLPQIRECISATIDNIRSNLAELES